MELKEVRQLAISVDIAFHISDYLEIEYMEHWPEAIGMQKIFHWKIFHANQMRKRLENLSFLKVKKLQTPSATDFKLKYRNLQRLTLQ